MNSDLLQEILSYLILLPAALTCLFPMKNKMKYSWKINVFHVCLFVMGFIFLAIFVDNNFDTSYNSIFLPILIFAFLAYDSELYIVSSNSCENKSKKWIQHSDRNEENDFSAYQIPTGLKGSGTGLKSIKATAEYYGGSASFFVKDNAFYVNVMLKGNCIPYSSSLQ